jgi:ABC-type multidrug transport system ATPase subunit
MPQDSAPSPHASLLQILCFYAELQGLSRRDARREADEWLGRVRLGDRAGHRLGQLSHGMRRRLNLAQALMGRPELILLDEPTAGLDPELAAEVRGLLSERRGLATIIVSSHVLSELEELCDHVVFMERGRQVQQGSMRSMRRASGLVRLRLSTEPDLDRLRAEIGDLPCEWQDPELRVTVDDSLSPEAHNARILRALLDADVGVLQLELGESLEAAYLASRRTR